MEFMACASSPLETPGMSTATAHQLSTLLRMGPGEHLRHPMAGKPSAQAVGSQLHHKTLPSSLGK
eukprot:3630447-Pyramimonas_sp.AAC.1